MNRVEKVCLELCEEIFSTSSVTDKTVLNYSVKLSQGTDRAAEVILVTKEDEYIFNLDLPEVEVYSETDSHFSHCSKCASENKYNLKRIRIKGFDAVRFGRIDLPYMKIILEKLAEDHARCIEENNSEKKIYRTGLFSVSENTQEPFTRILQRILDKVNVGIDIKVLLEGIKEIDKFYETILESKDYVFVYGNIFQNKLFVKNVGKTLPDYKLLNIRTEQNTPLVYDLLLAIFSFTDQNMRQHYFHELLDHYYKSFEKNLKKLTLDVTKFLPLKSFQRQVDEFIPHIKVETLKQMCRVFTRDKNFSNGENVDWHKAIFTSVLEVNECILYPNLSRENCYRIIKNKVGSSDYTLLNYKLIPLQEREGYFGDYFKLKIEIEHNDEVQFLHFFAKYLPTYDDMAKSVAIGSFKKEEFYYFEYIQQLNDLGAGDITNFLPKCYFSRTDEALIFEDMTMMNYKTFPVSVPYTYEMLLVTIKQLAKVHACSLLYEELLSKKRNEIVRLDVEHPEYIEERTVINKGESPVKNTLECAIRTFLEMLKAFPDIPKKFSLEEFIKRSKMVFDLCFEQVKKSDKFRNVLCQGDCWASNILFKPDKDNLPIGCCLVDYQLTRYCPPAHDIYFLLYMATTKETRKKFESKLLQEYYSELSNILQKHKVDLQKIYTYQEFIDSCEYMRSQGLCHAAMILQFVLFPGVKLKSIVQDKEQLSKLLQVNRDVFVEELKYGGVYRQRMKELAEELCDICENIAL